jgi:hypothetical protein
MSNAIVAGIHDEIGFKPSISVAPNPGNGIYHISYAGKETKLFDAQLLDRSGATIMSFILMLGLDEPDYVMDIQSLKDGVYILSLRNDTFNVSRKIIKK